MVIWSWIIIIVLVYFLLVLIIPFLIFPGFLIGREFKVTEKTRKIASKLKGRDKEKTLRNVFNYVTRMYSSEKYKLFLQLHKHFYTDIDEIIDKKQFLPCHGQSFAFVTLLISTGQFKIKDLERRITITNYGLIHQHYLIRVENKVFKVDPFYEIIEII